MAASDSMATFLARYKLLKAFTEREGHACVPVAHKELGFNLGRWVAAQRSHYHANKLSAECIDLLESKSGWVWRASDFQWDEGMEALRLFYVREGHVLVPNNHIENRFALGSWVSRQRKRLKNNRLTPKQAREFTALGAMDGNWRKKRNSKHWDARYQLLVSYANQHGTSVVPRHHIEEGVALGVWVNSLRSQHSKGVLSKELVERLEKLPKWAWAKKRKSRAD